MITALSRLWEREREFRQDPFLDQFPTSYREKVEVARAQEKELQEYLDKVMPHGYQYYDWDEAIGMHRGLHIKRSPTDLLDPERKSPETTLRVPPCLPSSNFPRTTCATEETPPPAVDASDTPSDTLSEASTLIGQQQDLPPRRWQPTHLTLVWILNVMLFFGYLQKKLGRELFGIGSFVIFMVLLASVWEEIRPLPQGGRLAASSLRRKTVWERLMMRFAMEIWSFCV
jgi:hypothetical protein